jgi:hypothetical protein
MAAKENAPAGYEPQRYEIRVRGPIGPTMMQAFPALTANRSGRDTLRIGSLPDQCALYGVIHELEALGLQLLEIRSLPISDSGTNRLNDAMPAHPGRGEAEPGCADSLPPQSGRHTHG